MEQKKQKKETSTAETSSNHVFTFVHGFSAINGGGEVAASGFRGGLFCHADNYTTWEVDSTQLTNRLMSGLLTGL